MKQNRLVGVFGCKSDAEKAREALLGQGIAAELSVDFMADPVAGEMPGQSYRNQPGQMASVSGGAWGNMLGTTERKQRQRFEFEEAVLGGACMVTAEVRRGAQDKIRQVMKEHGVRRTILRNEDEE